MSKIKVQKMESESDSRKVADSSQLSENISDNTSALSRNRIRKAVSKMGKRGSGISVADVSESDMIESGDSGSDEITKSQISKLGGSAIDEDEDELEDDDIEDYDDEENKNETIEKSMTGTGTLKADATINADLSEQRQSEKDRSKFSNSSVSRKVVPLSSNLRKFDLLGNKDRDDKSDGKGAA